MRVSDKTFATLAGARHLRLEIFSKIDMMLLMSDRVRTQICLKRVRMKKNSLRGGVVLFVEAFIGAAITYITSQEMRADIIMRDRLICQSFLEKGSTPFFSGMITFERHVTTYPPTAQIAARHGMVGLSAGIAKSRMANRWMSACFTFAPTMAVIVGPRVRFVL